MIYPTVVVWESHPLIRNMAPDNSKPVLYAKKAFCEASNIVFSIEVRGAVKVGMTNATQQSTAMWKILASSFFWRAPRMPDRAKVIEHKALASICNNPRRVSCDLPYLRNMLLSNTNVKMGHSAANMVGNLLHFPTTKDHTKGQSTIADTHIAMVTV